MNNIYDFPGESDPPHNFEIEMGLLGGILLNNRTYDLVSDFLKPGHFYDGAHATVYAGICVLMEKGRPANPDTLKRIMSGDDFKDIGGVAYAAELMVNANLAGNAKDYGAMIVDLYQRRMMIEIFNDTRDEAVNGVFEEDAHVVAQRAMGRLSEIADLDPEGGPVPIAEAMEKAVAMVDRAMNEGRPSYRKTGLIALDGLIGGLPDNEVTVIGARPGMGKTAIGVTIAHYVAKTEPVMYFSLEMDDAQIGLRVACMEAQVDSSEARKGKLSPEDFQKLSAARTASTGLIVDPTTLMTIQAISGRARRAHKRNPLGLVVVDYLGLMRPVDPKRNQMRVYEIEEYTQGLKALAKYLKCPVLVLHQLSRQVEQREDKRPILSDLRDSGSIEQDAALVMFLYRHEEYLARSEPPQSKKSDYTEWLVEMAACKGQCEVIVAKHRFGPANITKMVGFDAKTASFRQYQKPEPVEPGLDYADKDKF